MIMLLENPPAEEQNRLLDAAQDRYFASAVSSGDYNWEYEVLSDACKYLDNLYSEQKKSGVDKRFLLRIRQEKEFFLRWMGEIVIDHVKGCRSTKSKKEESA